MTSPRFLRACFAYFGSKVATLGSLIRHTRKQEILVMAGKTEEEVLLP